MSGGQWNPAEDLPWSALCEEAGAPIGLIDLQGRPLYVNRAVCQLFGYERDEILRSDPQELFQITPSVAQIVDHVLAAPESDFSAEVRFLRCDGGTVWVLLSGSPLRDQAGAPLGIILHAQDITSRKEIEIRWHQTFAQAPIGMAQLDLGGHWKEVNAALCDLLGYNPSELLGRHYGEIAYPDEKENALVEDVLAGNVEAATVENRYRHKLGYPLWVLVRISAVPGTEGKPTYLIAQYEEIGDRRMADAHLAHLALHDPLTGLANRALLTDRIHTQLTELSSSGQVLIILLADFDEFKAVNDNYGHLAGDRFLVSAADKLLSAVGAAGTASRYGGDEFIVLGHAKSLRSADAFRGRVEEALRIEFDLEDRRVGLQASVGLATATDPDVTVEGLLHEADRDMYRRKLERKRNSAVASPMYFLNHAPKVD